MGMRTRGSQTQSWFVQGGPGTGELTRHNMALAWEGGERRKGSGVSGWGGGGGGG